MRKEKCLLILFCFLIGLAANAQETLVEEIVISGNERLKTRFVHNFLKVSEGMSLDSVQVERDLARLKRLPAVAHATYEVLELSEHRVALKYTLEENFTLIPFANIYSSTNEDFAFRVGLQEFNFLGSNITLGGFYQYDIFHSFGAHFRAPYLFSKKLGLSISYTDLTTQEPVFFDENTADYRYNNRGLEVLGLYEINAANRFAFGGSLFTEDYSYLQGATDPSVPLALNVNKHLLKLMYDYDKITYEYQYLSGFKSSLNFQYVESPDQLLPGFLIGFNDFAYFRRIGAKGNWASRLRLGLASNLDTPFAPFTVDNNLNIRGVGNIIDRGTGAIVLNTEYRHTWIDKNWFVLQSNVFLDAGSWRNPGGDFGDFSDTQNIRVYPGIGVRFIHKRIFNAIFRIDYGHGISEDPSRGLVFGIGQYF